jgi:hypothetical protein
LRWRRRPVFERFSRFRFSILFWKLPAGFLGSRGVKPVPEGCLAASRRKGKADLRGSASFVDRVRQEQCLQRQAQKPWAFTLNNASKYTAAQKRRGTTPSNSQWGGDVKPPLVRRGAFLPGAFPFS